ncbi:MAG: hypothetical protein MI739_03420 [Bacteroidales bacterium]|nr:hypothetical protein [Bacteroidales bacterium]
MKELEEKTYQYSINGVSLIKSLEKTQPELITSELKSNLGGVSTHFMNAFESKENSDFADCLRNSHVCAKNSLDLLNKMGDIANQDLNKQKEELIDQTKSIVNQLNTITQKLIY